VFTRYRRRTDLELFPAFSVVYRVNFLVYVLSETRDFHPTVYIKKHKTSQCLYELSATEVFSR